MKINPLFVLREIADEYMVIPLGEEAERIHGILVLNQTGVFLWKLLESEQTEAGLLDALTAEFNVETDTAKDDISSFLSKIKEIGCLL